MAIILTFVLNAALNMVLGLAVAAVLGPEQYGRFAQGFVLALMLASGLFEWLRLATTRFYGEAARTDQPQVRATLNMAYLTTMVVVSLAAAFVLAMRLETGMAPAMLGAALLASIASGVFEFRAALARARFLNRTYGLLVIVKNVLALALMVGAGLYFQDGAVVLAAFCLAILLSILPVEFSLRDKTARLGLFDKALLQSYARYGLPIVAGNVLYQLILLINRSWAVAEFGYGASGQLSLATDLSMRIFISLGAALDVLLFQMAVRAEAQAGRAAAHAQLAHNMLLVFAVLLPLAALYMAHIGAFEAVFVPQHFHGPFANYSLILVPGIVLLCLGQFAFSPVFQLAGRTLPLIGAALASLVFDVAGLALLPKQAGMGGIAVVHTASLAMGCVATACFALREATCRPPWRDMAWVMLGAAAMLACVWPLRGLSLPLVELAVAGIVGACVYLGLMLAFDVGGIRGALRGRRANWRANRAALMVQETGTPETGARQG